MLLFERTVLFTQSNLNYHMLNQPPAGLLADFIDITDSITWLLKNQHSWRNLDICVVDHDSIAPDTWRSALGANMEKMYLSLGATDDTLFIRRWVDTDEVTEPQLPKQNRPLWP